ncbi:unnamed protein product [Caenorhabditis brenneri]
MDNYSSTTTNNSNGLTWEAMIPIFSLESIPVLVAIGGCGLTYKMKKVTKEIKNLQYFNYAILALIAILSMCRHAFMMAGFGNNSWWLGVAITVLSIFAAIHRILRVSAFSISFVVLIKERRDYGTLMWIIVATLGVFVSALPVIILFFVGTASDQRFSIRLNKIKIAIHIFILLTSVVYFSFPWLLIRRKPFNITKSNAIDSKIHYCHKHYRALFKLCALNGIISSIVSLSSEIVVSHSDEKQLAQAITYILHNLATFLCYFHVKEAREDWQRFARKQKRRMGVGNAAV